MATQLQRDPFGRMTLMRERIDYTAQCAECGQPAKFEYWWEEDRVMAYHRYGHTKAFCCVGCWRSYVG
jgi:hypothetical protein